MSCFSTNTNIGGLVIKDKHGNLLMELDKMLKRLEEYTRELYDDARGAVPELEGDLKGPSIIGSEVTAAMAKMKSGTAVG